jgi:hypothetical protein
VEVGVEDETIEADAALRRPQATHRAAVKLMTPFLPMAALKGAATNVPAKPAGQKMETMAGQPSREVGLQCKAWETTDVRGLRAPMAKPY